MFVRVGNNPEDISILGSDYLSESQCILEMDFAARTVTLQKHSHKQRCKVVPYNDFYTSQQQADGLRIEPEPSA